MGSMQSIHNVIVYYSLEATSRPLAPSPGKLSISEQPNPADMTTSTWLHR